MLLKKNGDLFQKEQVPGTKKTDRRELLCRTGRIAAAVLTVLLLIYYCRHPEFYTDEEKEIFILSSRRTYAVMAASVLLLALSLIPVRLPEKRNRILTWIWFAAAPFAVYFSLLHLNAQKFSIEFSELNRIALVFTFLFLFLLELLFLVITGSVRIAVMIEAVLIAALGIGNCFVISFRGMALSAADLFSLEAAASVASEYTYRLDWYMYSEILCTFAICLISLKLTGYRVLNFPMRLAALALWAAGAGSYYYVCCRTDFLEEHDIRSEGFTHQLRYKQYDMLFTTLTTCFYLSVDKPDGYSLDEVKAIAAPYLADDGNDDSAADGQGTTGDTDNNKDNNTDQTQNTPNLIVIMNESFADYTEVGKGLDLSEDCMPYIRSLEENTIKGYAYASIFGGNTPNSEYEFLTGNTMGFLPASSVGFNLFVRGNLPSVASELKECGYETMAIHPYRGTNYRRHIVYPLLGFDTYYTRDDFFHPKYIRNFISDESLAERIISEFEDRKDSETPLFCYNVTVQNHGGYYASNTVNLDMSIEVENKEVDQTKTSIYVNLIRESDKMFQMLTEYFEQQEEPTVIVMFGDHQANLGDNTYEYLIGADEDLSAEQKMEKYKIPFVIWANYDIPEETIEKTSLNYLYSILADRLQLPMTGYQNYLLDLSEKIPVLCAQGYWGDDGNYYELDDENSPYYEDVNQYNILEYNDIFGGKNRYLDFFS